MEDLLNRIKTAIDFLKDGMPFKVGELYFGIDENYFLNVTGTSKNIYIENLNKELALKEIQEIKRLFGKMVIISIDLNEFIIGKQLKFNLDFDYGMGDIRICSEVNGVVIWGAFISDPDGADMSP